MPTSSCPASIGQSIQSFSFDKVPHYNYPFRISAAYSTTRQCVEVVSIGGEHNCIGAGQIGHGPSQQTRLQRCLPMTLAISKFTGPREIVDAAELTTMLQ